MAIKLNKSAVKYANTDWYSTAKKYTKDDKVANYERQIAFWTNYLADVERDEPEGEAKNWHKEYGRHYLATYKKRLAGYKPKEPDICDIIAAESV